MLKVRPSSRYSASPLLKDRKDPRIAEPLKREIDPPRLDPEIRREFQSKTFRDEHEPRFRSHQDYRRQEYENDDYPNQEEMHYRSEYRREFDPYDHFDERYKKKQSPRKSWKDSDETERPSVVKYILSLTLLVCIAIFSWLLYKWTSSSDVKEPVLIQGSNEMFKVRPENPGGVNIPHQDMLVYGHLSNKETMPPEKLLPPPEKPVIAEEVQEPQKQDTMNIAPAHLQQSAPAIQQPQSPRYIAVLASFPSKAQADLEMTRLKRQYGFKNLEVVKTTDGKLYRVSFKTSFNSIEEAEDMCAGKRGCRVIRNN